MKGFMTGIFGQKDPKDKKGKDEQSAQPSQEDQK